MSRPNDDYTKKAKNVKSVPLAELYPELLPFLAEVSYAIQELHKLVTIQRIADTLDTDPQRIDYHIQKIRKGKNG